MPKRDNPNIEANILIEAKKRTEAIRAMDWFKKLTGRIIYETPTISLMNKTVIDRPVTLALNGTTIEPETSLSPIETMTNSMVDGFAVARLGPGWEFIELVPFHEITILELDGLDFIKFIRFEYPIDGEEGDRWFRRDYFKIDEFNEKGQKIGETAFVRDWGIVRKQEDFDQKDPIPEAIAIEFIPFVAFPWKNMESFFERIKLAVIHLEGVANEISTENIRHSTRKLFIKAPTGTTKEVVDFNDAINLLTQDGDAFYPDPHSAGMVSIFKEEKKVSEAIENATGVIATEKIVALSGVSRMIAMKSLTDLAKEIRSVFTKGMIRIETIFNRADSRSGTLLINYQPIAMVVTDPLNQYELLEKAHLRDQISDHEFREATRVMLSI